MKPGIYDLSREEYDALKRTNWSLLKHISRSPAHYRHSLLNKRKDTPALRRGRVSHHAVYEPEVFASEVVIWEGGDKRGTAWKDFERKHAHLEILKPEEHAQCVAIADAVRNDPVASRYVSIGRSEQTAVWTHEVGGIEAKGRLDFLANAEAIVDLKTCREASPAAFGRACANFDYAGQAAYYVDGHKAATGLAWPYILVAVEAEPPHVVQVYRVPERVLDFGRNHYVELLQRLHECRTSNRWGGYFDGEAELELPTWAMPRPDDDLSEMGLIFNEGN